MSAEFLLAEVRLLLAKIDSAEVEAREAELRYNHHAHFMGARSATIGLHRQAAPLRALVEKYDSGKLCEDCFGPAFHDNGMVCRCGDNS